MKKLYLEDLSCMSEVDIKNHLVSQYSADVKVLKKLKVLIAYESVGSWGCDSSSFFLFKNKEGQLFTCYGSHCSCYGFEDQFSLEPTELKYLKSDKFYVNTGGYDTKPDENLKTIKTFISKL